MSRIRNLPIELMSLIFNLVYESSRKLVDPEYYEDPEMAHFLQSPNPPETTWASDNLRDPALFPFNVAWVCNLWRDVLSDSPEYWTRMCFDVVNDPTLLLDAFTWSKDSKICVLVFSSANDLTEEGKIRESSRAESIAKHLQPHIERCTSIVFDLTFASSLPSPTLFLAWDALFLEHLTLEGRIHDLMHVIDNGKSTRITRSLVPVKFPKLTKLSMSGIAFMDILHLGDDWLATVKVGPYLILYISDFQFQTMKPCPTDSSSTFDFMRLISALNPGGGIHLKNLSLSCRPHKRRDTEHSYDLYSWSMSFDNVSTGFIMEFFQLATWTADYTTFSHCSVPSVSGNFSSQYLTIEHIPSSNTSHDDDSLYNVISMWNSCGNLIVTSCSSFDDKFLQWLGGEGEDGTIIETEGIVALDVHDCTNFTAGALRRLIDILNDLATFELQEQEGWQDGERLESVTVYGRGPALDDEDLEWFQRSGGETHLHWCVKGADGSEVNLERKPASWG
ncbi:hypothetical protein BDZ97DRAFT_1761292 [Flammula alnicola]|nr:hypothetical protein BDZ97DRAFT_1761292 [Flammula alnicola]